jgi:hypothetical protein
MTSIRSIYPTPCWKLTLPYWSWHAADTYDSPNNLGPRPTQEEFNMKLWHPPFGWGNSEHIWWHLPETEYLFDIILRLHVRLRQCQRELTSILLTTATDSERSIVVCGAVRTDAAQYGLVGIEGQHSTSSKSIY